MNDADLKRDSVQCYNDPAPGVAPNRSYAVSERLWPVSE